MQTFREVIAVFGGAASMASTFDDPSVSAGLIRQWANRDSIPSGYWPLVVKHAEAKAFPVTFDLLARLASRRKGAVVAEAATAEVSVGGEVG